MNEEIDTLQGQLEEARAREANLEGELETATLRIAELKGQLAAAALRIEELEGKLYDSTCDIVDDSDEAEYLFLADVLEALRP